MKAARYHRHGEADVLVYEDAPDPVPSANEVLVRVRACSLNHLDLWLRRGLPGIRIPLPHIGGSDIAGEVIQAGELASQWKAGERVFVSPGICCEQCPACYSGQDSLCRAYTLHGFMTDGGYGEYVKTRASCLYRIPDALDFVTAAAAPLVFLTAWHMLVGRAGIRNGESVLVLAAASGVGQAAIQIAKMLGARVITTAGNESKAEAALQLGADKVIRYRSESILDEVRGWTSGRGVDVVIEHVGEATFDQTYRSVAAGGRWVTCGVTSGYAPKIDLRHLFSKQLTLLGSYMGSRSELCQVMRFIFDGQLKPVIDSVFPLRDVRDAHRRLESGEHFGKIVLQAD